MSNLPSYADAKPISYFKKRHYFIAEIYFNINFHYNHKEPKGNAYGTHEEEVEQNENIKKPGKC